MTGEGHIYHENQQELVQCVEYGTDLARGSLDEHHQTQHSVARGGVEQKEDHGGGGNNTRTFQMAFLAKSGPRPCSIEGCNGQAATRMAMQVHLWHRNVRYTVVILEY